MSDAGSGRSGPRPRPQAPPDVFDSNVLRALVFAVAFGVITLGPLYRQVFGGESELFRPWTMYHDNGMNMVTFAFERHRNGAWEPFDVVPVLKARLGIAPQKLLRIDNEAALDKIKLIVCRAFPDADLRVSAHQADRIAGWRTLAEREPLTCARQP